MYKPLNDFITIIGRIAVWTSSEKRTTKKQREREKRFKPSYICWLTNLSLCAIGDHHLTKANINNNSQIHIKKWAVYCLHEENKQALFHSLIIHSIAMCNLGAGVVEWSWRYIDVDSSYFRLNDEGGVIHCYSFVILSSFFPLQSICIVVNCFFALFLLSWHNKWNEGQGCFKKYTLLMFCWKTALITKDWLTQVTIVSISILRGFIVFKKRIRKVYKDQKSRT